MRQAEKALRDAGWVRTVYGDLDTGEEFYVPSTGALLIKRDRVCVNTDAEVLRAPRPEPEYELGTVARIRTSDGDVRNAVYGTHDVWATGGMGDKSPRVEVLRVIAYPDGTIPPDGFDAGETTRVEVIDSTGRVYVNSAAKDVQAHFQDDGRTLKVFTGGKRVMPRDRDELVEGMVPRVARELCKPTAYTSSRQWADLPLASRESWECEARQLLREAYEEATRDDD